jgi:hypothetical protein
MILVMPPMSDPSEFNPEISRPPDSTFQRQSSLSRPRGLPNPVSEVTAMVQALAAAGQGHSQSAASRDNTVEASRMMSTTQGPYSEYMDISRASATPWRPIQDWSNREAHSPITFTQQNSNSPPGDLPHCSPQEGTYQTNLLPCCERCVASVGFSKWFRVSSKTSMRFSILFFL